MYGNQNYNQQYVPSYNNGYDMRGYQQIQQQLQNYGINSQYGNQQQGNQMQNNYQQVQQSFPQVRPVTGIEEVRATSISFDGTVSYFIDKANNCIYTKYIDLNGLAQIQTYKLEYQDLKTLNQTSTSKEEIKEYVSRDEFKALQDKIGKYELMFNELMGVNKNE